MTTSGVCRSILLLVSSMSASGCNVRSGPHIMRILRGGDWKVAVHLTAPGDDPAAIAGEIASGSFVVALGDNGYLGAMTRGCHEFDAIFVPTPGGHDNNPCRALRISTGPLVHARSLTPLGFSSNEAGADSSDWLAPRIRPLDGMRVRSRDGMCLALGIVSIGLDARANILANESSFISGLLTYGYGVFAALASHGPIEIVATMDGVERSMNGWIVSASNSGVFGGGITLVESSDMSDGVLEVCHVGPLPLSHALPALTRAVAGHAKAHSAIEVENTHVVPFVAPASTIAIAGGDRITPTPFTVGVAPGVVSILV